MTREQAKEMWPVVKAFADGETLQLRFADGWRDLKGDPFFTDTHDQYRIKPTPKLRAWKPEEVPVGAVLRGKKTGNQSMIIGVTLTGSWSPVHCYNGFYSTESLLNENEYSIDCGKTWLPCGVEDSQ